MPRDGLNPRQEAFAQNLVANGMNATVAYKAAGYSAKKDVTARNGAHELLTNPYVAARVSELQKLAAVKHAKTVDTLVSDLDDAIALARECKNPAAIVSGIVAQARLLGLLIDRQQVETLHKPSRTPTEHREMSEAEWLARYSPDHRQQ
jgi:hypothetical protein